MRRLLLTFSAAAVLTAVAPLPAQAVRLLRTGATWSAADPATALVPVVALLAWACLGWLAAVALTCTAARLPGRLGRVGAAVNRRVAPAAVRRAVEVALGLTVAVGAVGAPGVAVADSGSGIARLVLPTPTAGPGPDLDWPVPTPAAVPAPLLAPDAPRPDAPRPDAPRPDALPSRPAQPAAPAQAAGTARAAEAGVVVVRPGDCLWRLAERRLGPGATPQAVAAAWPAWWAANREVIGPDPDLLMPGTRLSAPAS